MENITPINTNNSYIPGYTNKSNKMEYENKDVYIPDSTKLNQTQTQNDYFVKEAKPKDNYNNYIPVPQTNIPYIPYNNNQNQVIGIPFDPNIAKNNSNSGVNIVIYNPSVIPGNASIANSYCSYPVYNSNTNNKFQPKNTVPNNDKTNLEPELNDKIEETPIDNENGKIEETPNDNENDIIEEDAVSKEDKSLEDPKTKNVTYITDEYVKTLENYLRNENTDIRVQGMKKLMDCFREDPSTRSNDIALNNLLNLALRDPSHKVRFLALCTLENKWADGDDLTYEILEDMQQSSNVYGQDAMFASNLLLNRVKNEVNIEQPITSISELIGEDDNVI